MKPPWTFLAQLVSRQPASDIKGQSAKSDHDGKPVEIELQPTPALLLTAPEETLYTGHDDQHLFSKAVDTAIASETERAAIEPVPSTGEMIGEDLGAGGAQPIHADAQRLAPASEKVTKPPNVLRANAARRKSNGGLDALVTFSVVAAAAPASLSPSRTANPFFEEAVSLDEDIRQLTDQLAQKLRLQNAQLRTMLEPFDRS